MNKILVLGAFGYSNNQLDGQTIKTRNVYNLLLNRYNGSTEKADTLEFRRKPWCLLPFLFHLVTCRTLIIIPCLNNLTFLFPCVYIFSKLFKFKIVSICVGGWQVEYFEGDGNRFRAHPLQLKYSKRINAFLPEMEKVEKELIDRLGFDNTAVFPNFRSFKLMDISLDHGGKLKLVYMARINRQKGYPGVFEVLDRLRKEGIPVTITFYGQVSVEDKDDFFARINRYKDVACYGGALSPDVIQDVLKQQDVLLLLTKYYTEGFPGSVLDAYIAGIPVIVTEWKHSHEFVKDKITGFIVPFEGGINETVQRIILLNNDRRLLHQMKINAREESKRFSEDAAWRVLNKYL